MSPNWSSRNFPDHSELCSNKIWPTMYHINQHSRPRTSQATRPVNVARRSENSPGEKEPDLVAYNIRKADSSGQILTIALQSQMGCCLPPVEDAAEFANLVQARPRQSKLHKAAGSQKGGDGGRKKVPYQSTLILIEPAASLAEHHKEQFSADNHGSRLSKGRNIESNAPEENTKVKINESRMSPHDTRVELGEPTKTTSTHKGPLGNSEQ